MFDDTDRLGTTTLRLLAADAVQEANSGHPGLPLGAADLVYSLWSRHMKHNPADPRWPDHDRFGGSAPYKVLFEQFGFTVDNVVARAKEVLAMQPQI